GRALGGPEGLVGARARGEPLTAAPRSADGVPEPAGDWLVGIAPENWLRLAERLAGDDGWAGWWRAGLNWFLAKRQLRSEDLLPVAVDLQDPDLLRRAQAPPELVARAGPAGPPIAFPPAGKWPDEGDRLLAARARDGTLLERVAEPDSEEALRAGLDWLQQHGGDDVFRLIAEFLRALRGEEPA